METQNTATMKWTTICYLLFCSITFSNSAPSSPSLMATFVVLRHGDRTPTWFYANDPFRNESYWAPDGIGEMNAIGRERTAQAGALYRKMYQDFLQQTQGWPTRAKSSSRDRSVKTAALFLGEFLQISPDASMPMIAKDALMLTTSYPCNRSNEAWLTQINSPTVTDFIGNQRAKIEYIGEKSGEDFFAAAPFTLRNLEFIATTLEIERDEYRLDVPKWTRNETTITTLAHLKRGAFLFDWQPEIVQRYRVGPLLGDISANIEAVMSIDDNNQTTTSKDTQRFFLYSTHDVNQVLLLQALDMYGQIGEVPTSYSSAIVFEVYRSLDTGRTAANTNDPLIRVLYREVIRNEISQNDIRYSLRDTPLNITGCIDDTSPKAETIGFRFDETICPFSRFRALIADKVPQDFDNECRTNSANAPYVWPLSIGIILLFNMRTLIRRWY